jgi:RNAse (barnase) inhibitor barstar
MRDWGTLFKSCGASGLYTFGTAASLDEIGKKALACGLNYFYIDLARVADKQAFLGVLATKLDFPAHFGMNWDALKDSLTDMPADSGCVIVLDNINNYAKADPAGMGITRNIFKYTAGYWKKQAVSFFVLTRL